MFIEAYRGFVFKRVSTLANFDLTTIETVLQQWQAVERLASEVSSRHAWLFMLRFTEDDQERFHEWGFVLTIFREFICASPDTEFAERLVFGYD